MRAVLAVMASCLTLLVGCTGGHDSASPSSRSESPTPPGSGTLPTCPEAGGDSAVGSPTFISPLDAKLRGHVTVLAHTTPAHATTVHAVVTSRSGSYSGIHSLVDSRIVLTRQVFETVAAARGIPNPLIDNPDHMLSARNVVATSGDVRTTDLNDHELTIVVPRGLQPRDYFVMAVQSVTPRCTPTRTGSSESVIGLVRVLTLDGHVSRLKHLPPHVH